MELNTILLAVFIIFCVLVSILVSLFGGICYQRKWRNRAISRERNQQSYVVVQLDTKVFDPVRQSHQSGGVTIDLDNVVYMGDNRHKKVKILREKPKQNVTVVVITHVIQYTQTFMEIVLQGAMLGCVLYLSSDVLNQAFQAMMSSLKCRQLC